VLRSKSLTASVLLNPSQAPPASAQSLFATPGAELLALAQITRYR